MTMMQALHGTFSRAPVDPQLAAAPTWTTQPAPASWLEVVGQDPTPPALHRAGPDRERLR
jgi:hypothetical protein